VIDSMSPATLLWPAALLLMAAFGDAAASGITVGALPEAQCPENSGVYSGHPDGWAPSAVCRFAFVPHWERSEPEAEALILIDGKLVRLHRLDHNENVAGPTVRYVFANDDGTIQVRLVAKAHCPPDVEGCDFDGVLSVDIRSEKATIKVDYYRGA